MTLLQTATATVERGIDYTSLALSSLTPMAALFAGWLVGRRKESAEIDNSVVNQWMQLYTQVRGEVEGMRSEVGKLQTKVADLERQNRHQQTESEQQQERIDELTIENADLKRQLAELGPFVKAWKTDHQPITGRRRKGA